MAELRYLPFLVTEPGGLPLPRLVTVLAVVSFFGGLPLPLLTTVLLGGGAVCGGELSYRGVIVLLCLSV